MPGAWHSAPLADRFSSSVTAYLELATTARLAVTPVTSASLVSYVGSAPPPPVRWTLTNASNAYMNVTASTNVSWLNLNASYLNLSPGDVFGFTATPNNEIMLLPDGFHTATITFTNTTNGIGSTTSFVTLEVRPPNTPPTISSISPQTSNGDSAIGPLSFTIGDDETPVSELSVSASSSNQTLIPDSSITLDGAGAIFDHPFCCMARP